MGNLYQTWGISDAYFTKYPIDSLYEIDEIFTDDNIDLSYTFEKHNAENISIASKKGWYLISLPLCDEITCDALSIDCSDGSNISAHNWYGTNSKYIRSTIVANAVVNSDNCTLLERVFSDRKFIASPEFIKDFKHYTTPIQKLAIEKFKLAIAKHLIFPPMPDGDIVKKCNGVDSAIYELRSKGCSGLRVYFAVDSSAIFIGGIGLKGEYSGEAQNKDIKRAERQIFKLKARRSY